MGSFLSLELDPDGCFLAIESPANSFASLAARLDEAMRARRLDRLQARALLLAYGHELCGTYARDANSPQTGDIHYRLEPVANPSDIAAWCEARVGSGIRGIRLARSCASEVRAGSASPAETIHSIVFTSSPAQGGMGMADVRLNESLKLDDEERLLVHRTPLTPDLTFPNLNGRVLEHQGGDHDSPRQYQEDASRVQDYGALGHGVFMTSAADFTSSDAYEAFLRRFVAWVRQDMGPKVAGRYQKILDDPMYANARHRLVSILVDRIHDPWHW